MLILGLAKGRFKTYHGSEHLWMRTMSHSLTKIGLISDTHGLLRDEAMRALEGSDLIIHAGDVGKPEIIDALKALAPVFAVRGNIDMESWAAALPETEVVKTGIATFYVLHDVHALDLDPVAAGFHIVVSGHSHKPARAEHGGVLYINPGSAGPRRFELPVTVARLDLDQKPWRVDFIDLSGKSVRD
jgi:putative phosphoesterase